MDFYQEMCCILFLFSFFPLSRTSLGAAKVETCLLFCFRLNIQTTISKCLK